MTTATLDASSATAAGLAIGTRVMGFFASTFATATLMVLFC